jgi:Phosphotransferase enzyme family
VFYYLPAMVTAAPPVPDTIEEALDPGWLTAALGLRFPGIEVTGVIPGPVVERLSTNARFTIECANGLPEGLAPDLCVKGYFGEKGRAIVHVGEPEARFYATLADATGVHTLRAAYADVNPENRHGVVITEDVVAAGGEFLDALSPYSPDQTARSLAELARLHAYSWGVDDLVDEPWLASRLSTYFAYRGVDDIQANFDGPVGVDVDPAVADAPRLADALRALAARSEGPGWTVIHGDAHVGNIFLDATGAPGILDWQVVQRGHWGIDVGYHIGSALTTPDRERSERDLLEHYLDCLRSHGVEPPGWDDAMDGYRAGLAYGYFMWAITLVVKPAIIQVLLQRLSAASAAHDAFGALGV